MDIKKEIKEETCFSDLCLQNDGKFCPENLDKKVKTETVKSGSNCDIDIKTEIEEKTLVINFCSENQRGHFLADPLMVCNKGNKDNEVETKVEVKEEQWWLKRSSTENLCIYDLKIGTEENLSFKYSPTVIKEEDFHFKSRFFSREDLGKDIKLNIVKDEAEFERARKFPGQENNVTNTGSVGTEICSKETDSENIDSMASCLQQNNFFQQSHINEHTHKGNCKSNLDNDNSGRNCKKQFKCDICEKCCIWLSDLKRHKLIHEGIKPHKCNVCNKAFRHLSHLKTHKLIHDGIKPHKCNVCNRAFTQFSSLKSHKLIHEDIKRYKCNICDKPFSRLSDLKTHTLIHEGKKPHKCNICDKAFTQLSSLKTHTFIHEGVKPHKCSICDKGFTRLSHLKTHKCIHKGN